MQTYIKQHSGVLKAEGVAMLILGVIAIILPVLATFAITLLIGGLLVVGGCITAYRGIRFKGFPGATASLIFGVISALVGLFLVFSPQTGVEALTAILVVLFMFQGISEIAASLQHRQWSAWVWMMVSGVASLLIALLLLISFPESADWAIGLLVGINLLFTSFWLLVFGAAVESIVEPETLP
ncbi:MAG: DUF308 domain-containing protein [Desulfurivibrio sp.]|nr:DUF308 domain-containing protein [Desulfurivibrio sp.]